MAHFKPFARAEAGAPSHRHSSRHSRSDSSHHHRGRRRHHRRRHGLVVIDF